MRDIVLAVTVMVTFSIGVAMVAFGIQADDSAPVDGGSPHTGFVKPWEDDNTTTFRCHNTVGIYRTTTGLTATLDHPECTRAQKAES